MGFQLPPPLSLSVAIAVTLAFLLFAMGHWSLLKQGLTTNRALQKEIRAVIASKRTDNQFKSSIEHLVTTANPPWVSRGIHFVIDGCAVFAIWYRVPEFGTLLHAFGYAN
jgi:hypothetical protein